MLLLGVGERARGVRQVRRLGGQLLVILGGIRSTPPRGLKPEIEGRLREIKKFIIQEPMSQSLAITGTCHIHPPS